jgi:PBSX family phage terminase large subunit
MDINIQPSTLWIKKFDKVFSAIFKCLFKNYIFPGGRGSTKSSFISLIIPLLIIANPRCHAAIFRKVGNTLKTSVLGQIQWAIAELGLSEYFITHVNPMEIIYKPTGQKILFFGLDDAGKIKSVKLPFGYIGITWWEELDQFSGEPEIRKVLQSTQRGGDKYWNFMSFNPPLSKNNWANEYTEECERHRQDDTLVVRSTYLDVPMSWLGQAFIDEAEYLKSTNRRAYDNEMLGLAVGTGGNIFPNVEHLEMTDEMIGNFDVIYNGLDWGFANDPNAYTKMYFDKTRQDLYIFGEHVRTHESNLELFEALYQVESYNKKTLNRETGEIEYVPSPFMEITELVTADSAEPKSISDFKSYGAFMRGMEKYPDSIRYGIKWLQSLNHIYIDKFRCPETYDEFTKYEYDRDKDGRIISAYPDENNHTIDSVRYALNRYYKRKGN